MPPEAPVAAETVHSGASSASTMSAWAALSCELDQHGISRVTRMRSEGQLVLRPTHAKGFEPWAHRQSDLARVSLSAGTAGPLGGDRLHFDVVVGAGASLVLNEISATLALPGRTGEQSLMTIDIHVGEAGSLIWMPEPIIAARGCNHRQQVRVRLAESARLFMREELVVGRHKEQPGAIAQRVRVSRGSGALYDQELRLGPHHLGWDSPAVADSAKCVGSTLVVDPGSTIGAGSEPARARSEVIDDSTALLGLAPDAVQISSTGADNLEVSRSTRNGLELLGPPWALG